MEDWRIRRIAENLDWDAFTEFAAIVALAWLLIKASAFLLPLLAERVPGRLRLRVLAAVPMLRLIAIVAAIAMSLPIFVPMTTQNVIALLGASGIAIGFAVKDYVSSLIAGMVVLIEQPYKPGDWVRIDGSYGEVVAIGLRTVTLRTPDDDAVIVPHQNAWTGTIANANSGHRELQCAAEFHLHPAHDAPAVRRLLEDVALTSPYLQLEKPIQLVAAELPWGTRYRLKAYPVDARDQFMFITDLTLRGKAALMSSGIRFAAASPSVDAASG